MITVRPALPASDLVFFGQTPFSRQHGRAFAMQLGGEAFTVLHKDEPAMIAGRYVAADHQEIWMMHSPALKNPFVLARSLKVGRGYLRRWRASGPVMVCAVAESNEAGKRLAQLIGFANAGPHPDAAGCLLFVFMDAPLKG